MVSHVLEAESDLIRRQETVAVRVQLVEDCGSAVAGGHDSAAVAAGAMRVQRGSRAASEGDLIRCLVRGGAGEGNGLCALEGERPLSLFLTSSIFSASVISSSPVFGQIGIASGTSTASAKIAPGGTCVTWCH